MVNAVIILYFQVVNSHGVIGSLDNDHEDCAACLKGSCRSINGIYTRPDLPPGYSLVAQIPAGACRIFIQQMKHSRNFLGEHLSTYFCYNLICYAFNIIGGVLKVIPNFNF